MSLSRRYFILRLVLLHQKKIIVVTAPSGTGKTTLNRRLVQEIKNIEISISHTTRNIRAGETNGDHYWFVSLEDFKKEIDAGHMLEWANVFGNMYGTSKKEIDRITSKGNRVLLEIDVQGWEQTRTKISDVMAIFIMPPSIKVLWDRLSNRGTDDFQVRFKRLQTAKEELKHAAHYNHFIINEHLEKAFLELKELVLLNKPTTLTHEEGLAFSKKLVEEIDDVDWLKNSVS